VTVSRDGAIIGVSDHAGWAVLVTVAGDGTLLDRRRLDLLDEGLPKLPHHHEAQGLPLEEAVDLIERVRVSAARHAAFGFDAVASAVPAPILGVALRECPRLPATVAERLEDYRAQNVADTVMYRHVLAGAADARGWSVHWYRARNILDSARAALQVEDLDAHFRQVKRSVGPPWRQDHRVAMAAAIVSAHALGR
jgi:hypothetical protein